MAKTKDADQTSAELLLEEFRDRTAVMTVAELEKARAAYNPRDDLEPGDPDYEAIRRSIDTFNQVEPLVLNKRTGTLVGGHQRLTVLRDMGRSHAIVFLVDEDDEKERALNLVLNKGLGRWDPHKLVAMTEMMTPDMLLIGGFTSADEAYEMMRAAEAGSHTNFLDDIIHGSAGGGGEDGEDGAPRERLREIDMKDEHMHRTGAQAFDVTLVFDAEQRAIYYQAVHYAKKMASTNNTYEAVIAMCDWFVKDWERSHAAEDVDVDA